MTHDVHHEHLIKELAELLEPVLSNSPQAVYLYLDDAHKICNQKFTDLLGYKSIDEWVHVESPVDDIVEEDRDRVIQAYVDASEDFKASAIKAKIIKQDGDVLDADIIMVPITYKEEVFVLHFVSA